MVLVQLYDLSTHFILRCSPQSPVPCSFDGRFFWITQKCNEADLVTRSLMNAASFLPLQVTDCTESSIVQLIKTPISTLRRAVFFFYHSNGLYSAGTKSPLFLVATFGTCYTLFSFLLNE